MSNWQKPPLGALPFPGHGLSRGLVGCWIMNEGAGSKIYDLSGSNKSGLFVNAPTWIPSGIKTDGTSYIRLGVEATDYRYTDKISFAVKFKPATLTGSGNAAICGKRSSGGSGSGWSLIQMNLTAGLRFYVEGVSNVNTAHIITLDWHTLYGIYEGRVINGLRSYLYSPTGITIDINDPSGMTTEIEPNGAKLSLCCADGAGGQQWDGEIEYLFLWHRIISPSEISQLHADPYAMFVDPMVYWGQGAAEAPGGLSMAVAMHHIKLMRG